MKTGKQTTAKHRIEHPRLPNQESRDTLPTKYKQDQKPQTDILTQTFNPIPNLYCSTTLKTTSASGEPGPKEYGPTQQMGEC